MTESNAEVVALTKTISETKSKLLQLNDELEATRIEIATEHKIGMGRFLVVFLLRLGKIYQTEKHYYKDYLVQLNYYLITYGDRFYNSLSVCTNSYSFILTPFTFLS
jgi:hypothetical protein